MTKYNVTQISTLNKVLTHPAGDGKLFWIKRDASMFAKSNSTYQPDRICKAWNAARAGKEAFTYRNNAGYKYGAIFGKMFLAHRVIWAMHYGEWPDSEIDHINHNPIDNRIVNLRKVTHRENTRNRRLPNTNTSGHIGVCWSKAAQKWQAQINIDGKGIYLGVFENIEDAISARDAASKECNFHKNHGTK